MDSVHVADIRGPVSLALSASIDVALLDIEFLPAILPDPVLTGGDEAHHIHVHHLRAGIAGSRLMYDIYNHDFTVGRNLGGHLADLHHPNAGHVRVELLSIVWPVLLGRGWPSQR